VRSRAGRIVVGVDGSPASERALQWAAGEAVDRGVGLDVVHAWTMPFLAYPLGGFIDPAPLEREGKATLDRAVRSLERRGSPRPELRRSLVEEHAPAALFWAAQEADLLVVGSRGHGGFVGLLVGSVSAQCVSAAPCPVVVVPPSWLDDGIRRIVVGVDGSEPSYEALHWAVAEAARHSARLDVVNAYDRDHAAWPSGAMADLDEGDVEKASRALVEEMVAGAVGRGDPQPAGVEVISASSGPARALIETATGADLLVVGSRGRGSVRGLLLGSVSQQCVHHAPCPIVVTRPSHNPEQQQS